MKRLNTNFTPEELAYYERLFLKEVEHIHPDQRRDFANEVAREVDFTINRIQHRLDHNDYEYNEDRLPDIDYQFDLKKFLIYLKEYVIKQPGTQSPGTDVNDTILDDIIKEERLDKFWEKCVKDIDPDTHYWKSNKNRLSATLRDLQPKGYLKEGYKRLSQKQKIAIAKNTFGVDITNVVSKPSKKSPLDF